MRFRDSLAALLLVVFCLASLSFAQSSDTPKAAVDRLEPHTLYLNVGPFDTRQAPTLATAEQSKFVANKRHVLQLDGAMTPARRAALQDTGIVLREYLPQNAYVVEANGVAPATLASLGFVRWVGEYRNEWKLDPQIGQRAFQTERRQRLADQGLVTLTITLFEGREVDDVAAAVSLIPDVQLHGEGRIAGNNVLHVTLPSDRVAELAALDDVEYVEEAPEITYRNSTNRWIVQSNISGVTPLYDNGITGVGQIIGILDGKVDVSHCSFSDSNPIGPTHRKILAYNTSTGADSHGTHVAGTAAGDSGAFNDMRGVAYQAKFVFDDDPPYPFTESDMLTLLNQHHGQGARLHTNSWGDDGTTSYNGLARAIDSFSYTSEESLVLFAETNGSSLKNPENAKNVLAVGASQDTPNQASHCTGGVGPTADGRRKPEIYAPGCSTTSSSSGTSCSTRNLTGTSMASPAVAGTGALVRQYYTDGYYPSGTAQIDDALTPSGALLKATLINSAVDMTGIAGYPSNLEGWGRVLADNALYFPGDTRRLVLLADIRNANGLSTNDFLEYEIDVQGSGEQLRVTLAWTDAPASASTGTGFAAINDLDLEVEAPGGTLYRGNVFSGGVSIAGGSKDDRNNVEQVHLNAPAVGTWLVRVRADAVNVGTQGFALIATGDLSEALPALSIDLPSGAPAAVDPGVVTDFPVEITPGEESVQTGTERLYYRFDGGVYQIEPLTHVSGTLYTASLPAAICDETPEFYISATGDLGTTITEPRTAPAAVFAAIVGDLDIMLDDNFEDDLGWTVSGAPTGTDTGRWERGVPANGDRGDPPFDYDGSGKCWLTGNAAGNTDVDDGTTILTSPVFDMSNGGTITYAYWLNDVETGAIGVEDSMTIEVATDAGGTNWQVLRTYTTALPEWRTDAIEVGTEVAASATIRLRVSVSDLSPGDVVEGAFDAVHAQYFDCSSVVTCNVQKGDLNADLQVNGADIAEFVNCLLQGAPGQPACVCADMDVSAGFDASDVTMFVDCLLGQGCP